MLACFLPTSPEISVNTVLLTALKEPCPYVPSPIHSSGRYCRLSQHGRFNWHSSSNSRFRLQVAFRGEPVCRFGALMLSSLRKPEEVWAILAGFIVLAAIVMIARPRERGE